MYTNSLPCYCCCSILVKVIGEKASCERRVRTPLDLHQFYTPCSSQPVQNSLQQPESYKKTCEITATPTALVMSWEQVRAPLETPRAEAITDPRSLQELADLADVPWSSFPNPNGTPPVVLVKAALVRGPQLGLTVIATDLDKFHLETIRAPRVIRNKIQSGLPETQESQSSFVGEEGEKQLRAAVEEVLLGVRQGAAHVSLELAGGGVSRLVCTHYRGR